MGCFLRSGRGDGGECKVDVECFEAGRCERVLIGWGSDVIEGNYTEYFDIDINQNTRKLMDTIDV